MTDQQGDIITFDNVGLRYGTGKEVLSDVSFTLYPGSFYFLTGASGAGIARLAGARVPGMEAGEG